jgi:hypothetical protein
MELTEGEGVAHSRFFVGTGSLSSIQVQSMLTVAIRPVEVAAEPAATFCLLLRPALQITGRLMPVEGTGENLHPGLVLVAEGVVVSSG